MSPRESRQAWIRALEAVAPLRGPSPPTLPALVRRVARDHPNRVALLGCGESYTYADLAARIDQVAAWAARRCPGRTVGVLMGNRPSVVALWLGLTAAGCVAALLNPSLAGEALAHAVAAGQCDLVVADDQLAATLADAVGGEAAVLLHSGVLLALPSSEEAREAAGWAEPEAPDTALLVFTSGTTGLPKAARVSHGRVAEWALWFGAMLDLGPDDRVYDCLPLHHSTGGVVAIGAALSRGASVLVAPGFRAGTFWQEVAEGGCTVFFYIGELCRYLLGAPPQEAERSHRLRLACGNGLQAGVWEPFQRRFGIPAILEFYAATEGNVSLYNVEGLPGAVGRVPPFLRSRFPFALVRLDAEGVPLRDAAGRCVPAAPGEPGEAIGRVEADAGPARRFEGYVDPAAGASKLLRDAFAPGDLWFRSGDLMRRDEAGFVFFVDRLGDAFRWKGENVSAAEVSSVLRRCPGVADAVAYGVAVPGCEGKAGMAAVVPGPGFDLRVLWAHAEAWLPRAARPVFVRVRESLALTGTFKPQGAALAREGYAGLADAVWVADRAAGRYVPCDREREALIDAGALRL